MKNNHNEQNLGNKNQEESLEISSTGYGLESVTTESDEGQTKQQTKGSNKSCGGL
jgi:hypothetical protein